MSTASAVGVEIGTTIVSYIEAHPGQAVAFNRWYERDHFPATVKAGPGVFAGARFVATASCKALRPEGRLLGDPARGSFLGVAWVLAGKQAEWDAWVGREMETIAAEGRLFSGRDHVHTAIYRVVSTSDPVESIVALDRGLAGAIVAADVDPVPDLDVSIAVRMTLERTVISEAEPPPHELVVGLCAGDPIASFRAQAGSLASCGFASPFLAAIPGTDTYADEL